MEGPRERGPVSVFQGWGDLWDVVSGSEQERGEELDRRLAELNRDALESDRWTREQFNQAEENRMAGATGDTRSEVLGAAADGAVEGLKTIPDKIRGTVDGVAGWTLGAVPWWLWIVGAAGLFLYLGGGELVRVKLSRMAKA